MKTLILLAMLLISSAVAAETQMNDPDYLKIMYIDRAGVGHGFLAWQDNGTWFVGYMDTKYDTPSFYTGNETGYVQIV